MKLSTKMLSFFIAASLLPALSFAQSIGDVNPNPSSDCLILKNNLSYGMDDSQTQSDVSEMQSLLREMGFLSRSVTGLGYFGYNTRKAVKNFQNFRLTNVDENSIDTSIISNQEDRHTLAVDGFRLSNSGYVGKYTRAKIAYVSCHDDTSATSTQAPVTTTQNNSLPSTNTTSVQMSNNGVIKGRTTSLNGRLVPIYCGDYTNRKISLSFYPDMNGNVSFDAAACKQKGVLVWAGCPAGLSPSIPALAVDDFNGKTISCIIPSFAALGSSGTGATTASSVAASMELARQKGTPYIVSTSLTKKITPSNNGVAYYEVTSGDQVTFYGERFTGAKVFVGTVEVPATSVTDSSITFTVPTVSRPGTSVDGVYVTTTKGGSDQVYIMVMASSGVPSGACYYDEAAYKARGYKMTVTSSDSAVWISTNNMTLVNGKLYLLNKPSIMWNLWDVNTNQLTSTMLSCQDGVIFENGKSTISQTATQTNAQAYDPNFTSFTAESLAARKTIAIDWVNMFNGSLVPKVGDKTAWGGGTITRLANGHLVYDVGNNTQTREFGIDYNPVALAEEFPQLNLYWGLKYGINVAADTNARMGANANAYIHTLMYGLGSNFTEQNTFQLGNSASGVVGVYKDAQGVIMVKTLGGNFTTKQFASTNYYKALMDGGTTFNLSGDQQTNRAWPPIPVTTTVNTWSASSGSIDPYVEVQRMPQYGVASSTTTGTPYTVKWTSRNAAVVGWSCKPVADINGVTSGGFTGSGEFRGTEVNGAVSGMYTEAMLGVTRCSWHATSTQGVGSFGVFNEEFTIVCPVGKVKQGSKCL